MAFWGALCHAPPCTLPTPRAPLCMQAYASLLYLDDVLGRLFDYLEDKDMYKDTYVFFTSKGWGHIWVYCG
jgi:hypothetical protein